MPFDATRVSNNILKRSFNEKIDVTPMKLQKILYFVASEYAKDTSRPLLAEPFQVWKYGPVVQSVYSEFKPFRGEPIRRYGKDAEGKAYIVKESKNPRLRNSLDRVWAATKHRGAIDLSRITHLEGSGWFAAFQDLDRYISDEQLRHDRTYRLALGIEDSNAPSNPGAR